LDLSLRNVQKAFGQKQVLRDLSLDIRHGELFTLLGESGCGKTTLLRIIAGLDRPDAGTVSHGGQIWADPNAGAETPPQKRNVGFVFQNYAIWPHLAVADQVAYPLRNRRIGKNEIVERVERALALVGLSGLDRRFAAQLSGGQQQRVAVARAIVGEPAMLLLDEPFSNLDVNLRGQLRQELRDLQRKLGLTIILVTHDQADAFTISDRIALLREGDVEQVASPEDLYAHPASPYVRNFVGRSNSLTVRRVESHDDSTTLVELPGDVRLTLPGEVGGEEVDIWFRPEDLVVAQGSEPVHLVGTLALRQFLGDRFEIRVRLDDGQTLHAYHARNWVPPADGRIPLHFQVPPSLSSSSSS
jgi:ABC-type Fe3+/spermidine/putrescine transport system ATPase subunit